VIALAIAVLSTSAFSLIIRQTQRQGLDQMGVMMVNYWVASVTGFAVAWPSGTLVPSPPTWQIGLLGGVIYVTTYILIMHSMDLRGVAISNAVTRLSVLVPIAAAVVVWHEHPTWTQQAGAALAVVAMPFLTLGPGGSGQRMRKRKRQVLMLLALFLANGAVLITSMWFHSAQLPGETFTFFGIIYGSAAVVATGLWATGTRRLGWPGIGWGAILGVTNIVTGVSLLRALDTLPGAVVFPVFAALGLALTTGFAAAAWKETPGRIGWVGVAVALMATVVTNLQ